MLRSVAGNLTYQAPNLQTFDNVGAPFLWSVGICYITHCTSQTTTINTVENSDPAHEITSRDGNYEDYCLLGSDAVTCLPVPRIQQYSTPQPYILPAVFIRTERLNVVKLFRIWRPVFRDGTLLNRACYLRFGGSCCLHLQGLRSVLTPWRWRQQAPANWR
jgi:hypothetical protein